MSKFKAAELADFPRLVGEIKARIQQSQMRAVLSVNAELVRLYWDIGRLIDARQRKEGWGAGIIPRLARSLLPTVEQIEAELGDTGKKAIQKKQTGPAKTETKLSGWPFRPSAVRYNRI